MFETLLRIRVLASLHKPLDLLEQIHLPHIIVFLLPFRVEETGQQGTHGFCQGFARQVNIDIGHPALALRFQQFIVVVIQRTFLGIVEAEDEVIGTVFLIMLYISVLVLVADGAGDLLTDIQLPLDLLTQPPGFPGIGQFHVFQESILVEGFVEKITITPFDRFFQLPGKILYLAFGKFLRRGFTGVEEKKKNE